MTHQRVVITARGVFPTMVIQNIMQTPLSVMAPNVHQTRPKVGYVNVKHPHIMDIIARENVVHLQTTVRNGEMPPKFVNAPLVIFPGQPRPNCCR